MISSPWMQLWCMRRTVSVAPSIIGLGGERQDLRLPDQPAEA